MFPSAGAIVVVGFLQKSNARDVGWSERTCSLPFCWRSLAFSSSSAAAVVIGGLAILVSPL